MLVTLLGTGTSHGVPVLGCACNTCRSTDPRDARTRSSAHIQTRGLSMVIDTATEFRLQALRNRLERVDMVLLTHSHADHVCGFDDLRRFNQLQRTEIPVYGSEHSLRDIRTMFSYIFNDAAQVGGGIPQVKLIPVVRPFTVAGVTIVPVPVLHGRLTVLAYRIGPLAYVTDCSFIPESSLELLKDLELLILGVLRFKEHPTHFNLESGLRVIRQLHPHRTVLTHICHDFKHNESVEWLPETVELGYDGAQFEVREP